MNYFLDITQGEALEKQLGWDAPILSPTFSGVHMGNIVSSSMFHAFFLTDKKGKNGVSPEFIWTVMVEFLFKTSRGKPPQRKWASQRISMGKGSAFPVFPNDAMIWDEWQNRGLD